MYNILKIPGWYITIQKLIIVLILLFPSTVFAQSNNYWSRNFNEESSLLSGAVVGGGAGASAIFYNPASISEIEESKLSLNASLFSFEFVTAKNAWGDGMDFYDSRGYVIPRFFSYMLKLKNTPHWSFEVAFLNNANIMIDNTNYVDRKIDILKHLPGTERYTAFNKYTNKHRDDYFGIGGSRMLSENLSIGVSMFVSAQTNYYFYLLDIEAGSDNVSLNYPDEISYFSAKYSEQELVKFNDYRLLWKIGLLYKTERFSVGLNITTPSVGGIYSDGKRLMRKRSQNNISDPESGEPIPNYLVTDYKEKKDVSVNSKSPLSIAAGITWYNPDKTKVFYGTVEYFSKIDPYRIVETEESNDLAFGTIFEDLDHNEWLTFVDGAKPIFNIAVGYRWIIKENLMILSGFRTDFNYNKNFDYKPYAASKTVKNFDLDKYHLTSGVTVRILGHDLITGLQYTFGYEKDQKQFINLSHPVEFNYDEKKALQGTRTNTMNTMLNSVSIYFGATINFGQGKE